MQNNSVSEAIKGILDEFMKIKDYEKAEELILDLFFGDNKPSNYSPINIGRH
ncbi:MAG: hypothetical protein WC254_07720 [Candidatus Woesearchaeota archaeon]|jgi:hypothetical protein